MIRFEDVTVTYPGASAPTLAHVDLTVPEGELVLVVGRTGSGKTTLLRAINGLVPHFTGGTLAGRVVVAGRDTSTHPPRELADVVGHVSQDPMSSFVTDTVEDELAYGMECLGVPPDVMRRRVEETLDLLGLAELRQRPLRTLSGGQRQRVAIGAALGVQTRVLVLDEPPSALDPGAAEEVLAALQRLVHDLGVTVVLAEHRLERVVQYADLVVIVPGNGEPVRAGRPAEIMGTAPIAPPVVTVTASFPGADAATVAQAVAAPIETQVNGVDNMLYMQSTSSSTGQMSLSVYFQIGTDPDTAQVQVQNRVNIALPQLPDVVQKTGVKVDKRSSSIMMLLAVYAPDGRYDVDYVANYANLYVLDAVKRVPGANQASLFGAADNAMRVWLRPDRMAALGITPTDIQQAIARQNQQFGAGSIGQSPTSKPVEITVPVVTEGRFNTPEQFEDIILRTDPDGAAIVRLGDVGRAEGERAAQRAGPHGEPLAVVTREAPPVGRRHGALRHEARVPPCDLVDDGDHRRERVRVFDRGPGVVPDARIDVGGHERGDGREMRREEEAEVGRAVSLPIALGLVDPRENVRHVRGALVGAEPAGGALDLCDHQPRCDP